MTGWEAAVEAGARKLVRYETNGCCADWPKSCADCDCFRDTADGLEARRDRERAAAVLAAALPLVLDAIENELDDLFTTCHIDIAPGVAAAARVVATYRKEASNEQ